MRIVIIKTSFFDLFMNIYFYNLFVQNINITLEKFIFILIFHFFKLNNIDAIWSNPSDSFCYQGKKIVLN